MRKRECGVQVHQEKEELFELGVIEIETGFGHKVRVYDKERCICNLIMNRGKIEVQHFQTALKGYMNGKEVLCMKMYLGKKVIFRYKKERFASYIRRENA